MITPGMRALVDRQRLGFVATVNADGTPNLSPKGTVVVWDDEHLIWADIRSPRTIRNLRERPATEIDVVDPLTRKGFRFRGTCRVIDDGPELERIRAFYRDERSVTNPIRRAVMVNGHGGRGGDLARLRRPGRRRGGDPRPLRRLVHARDSPGRRAPVTVVAPGPVPGDDLRRPTHITWPVAALVDLPGKAGNFRLPPSSGNLAAFHNRREGCPDGHVSYMGHLWPGDTESG